MSLCLLALYFLMIHMPGDFSHQHVSASVVDAQKNRRLEQHVSHLSDAIGERQHFVEGSLELTADYIAGEFRSFGYVPKYQYFGPNDEFSNVVAELSASPEKEIIVIGAHYDTVLYTLGADDNASGVAGLLELARALKDKSMNKTVHFVAFANEEAPFYGTDLMGSQVYAKAHADENIVGMISLEMLGYYSDEPGSQRYPWPIRYFYPDTGNFIAFVGDLASRPWLRQSIAHYRQHSSLPAEGFVAPEWLVADVARSDQRSFWPYGIPAFMITDTANFRSPYYHFAGDVADTLDYQKMAALVQGIEHMIIEICK